MLVQCFAGISRSPTIVIAYLIQEFKMSYDDAYDLVLKSRPIARPNSGFVEQLKQLQQELEIK